jgi:RAD50-interacting protein 1
MLTAFVEEDSWQLTTSPELDEPLHVLTRNFEFLTKALSTAAFRRIWREALGKLQDQLWNDALLRHHFTTFGATQFLRDGEAVFSLIERYIPGGSAAMSTLYDGMRLLSLPVDSQSSSSQDEEGKKSAATQYSGLTLKEASDRVFIDNEEARKVLEELHLESLTPQNARYILQRRVENGENVEW